MKIVCNSKQILIFTFELLKIYTNNDHQIYSTSPRHKCWRKQYY